MAEDPVYEAQQILSVFPPLEPKAFSGEWDGVDRELPEPLSAERADRYRRILFPAVEDRGFPSASERDWRIILHGHRLGWTVEKVAAWIRFERHDENDPKGKGDDPDYIWRSIFKIYGKTTPGEGKVEEGKGDDDDDDKLLVLSPKQPLRIAEAFDKRYFEVGGLCRHRGKFFAWDGKSYSQVEDDLLHHLMYTFLDKEVLQPTKLGPEPFGPTRYKVSTVLDALKSVAYLDGNKEPPFWRVPQASSDATPLVAFRNGMLNIGTREFFPHTPEIFNTYVLPFDYNYDAPKPRRWWRFVKEIFPKDVQSQRALREILGCLLVGDTRLQKIFLFVGRPRSGKGTIGRLLHSMLGTTNIVAPTVSGFGSAFGAESLIGKRVAIIADAYLGRQRNLETLAEQLKTISGEDLLTVQRKYDKDWTGRLEVRFLILTNELPAIPDSSGGLVDRFVPLLFQQSFLGREDLDLDESLEEERAGIFNYALQGYERLQERGRFVVPKAVRSTIQQMQDLAAPIRPFLRESCVVEPARSVRIERLFSEWKAWCEIDGTTPGTSQSFGKSLHAALPWLRVVSSRVARTEKRKRYYEGIGLRRAADDEEDVE